MSIKAFSSKAVELLRKAATAIGRGIGKVIEFLAASAEAAIKESEARAKSAALEAKKIEYRAQLESLLPYYDRMAQALGDVIAVYHTVCGLVVPKNLIDMYPTKPQLNHRIAIRNGVVAFRFEVIRKKELNPVQHHVVAKLLGAQLPKYALQYGFTYRQLRVRKADFDLGPERILIDVIGVAFRS